MHIRRFNEASHIKCDKKGGGITNGRDILLPHGPTPNAASVDMNIVSGWPLGGLFPNREYKSRYRLDPDMLLEDLAIEDGWIVIPSGLGLRDTMERYHSGNALMSIGGLSISWVLDLPRCTVELGDQISTVTYVDSITSTTSPYVVDNGVALTDPTAQSISNHFIVKYGALDRGYGRMKHGWFYADVGGTWSWSVDGNDAVEIAIDDGVVASKYSNSSALGQGVLAGNISLAIGWHHLFAYTSDRTDASHPLVWFKRPGDPAWTALANDSADGIIWARGGGPPDKVTFSRNSGFLNVQVSYTDTDYCDVTIDETDFMGGDLSVALETVPRYRPYYINNWRESYMGSSSCPYTMPPKFVNIRGILRFDPISESMFYHESLTPPETTAKFLVSKDGVTWYAWNGTSFVTKVVDSISALQQDGNSMYQINNIDSSDWLTFLGSRRVCFAMFTGEPPLLLTHNGSIFESSSQAYYMLGSRSRIAGTVSAVDRSI